MNFKNTKLGELLYILLPPPLDMFNHTVDARLYVDGVQKAVKSVSRTSNAHTDDTFGGATDLWGTTWTPDEFSDARFTIVASIREASNNNVDQYLDYIKIKVYYKI